MAKIFRATIPIELDGQRLDHVLATLAAEHSRSFLARLIARGCVLLDGIPSVKVSRRVSAGQRVAFEVPEAVESPLESQDLPLRILEDDPDFVVVDKPAGLVVHPSAGHSDRTLVNALLFHVKDLSGVGGERRPGIVHRLDKDTSGVMIVAKNDETHRKLTAGWNTDRVQKEYLAFVYGSPAIQRGTIEAAIGRDPRDRKRMAVVTGGRKAFTEYEVADRFRYVSIIRCRLRTGRTHQIRVHLKHLGHPIVGDPLYAGPQWRGIPDKKIQKVLSAMHRQALHASRITIEHPRTGKSVTFHSELPADLQALVDALKSG